MRRQSAVPINKIIQISTVDGPGARTSIFVQACNLACLYCHNPETQRLCCHCGLCVPGCPAGALRRINGQVCWDEERCIQCDQCIKICPHYASPKVKFMHAPEVFAAIRDNFPFIRGITVSGGEATLYPAFLEELFSLVKSAGKTCMIDANGMLDLSRYPDLMALTDGVMLDFKAWSPDVFRKLTGRESAGNLQRNISYLLAQDKLFEIRLVYLPGFVDGEACLRGMAALVPHDLKRVRLKLIKFRNHGVRGELASFPAPSSEEMWQLEELARELGYGTIIRV